MEKRQHIYLLVDYADSKDGGRTFRGTLTDSRDIRTGFSALFIPPDSIADLDITDIDQDRVTFVLRNPERSPIPVMLERYLFIPAGYERAADAVVDKTWRKSVFEPKDVVQYRRGDHWSCTPPATDDPQPGANAPGPFTGTVASPLDQILASKPAPAVETRVLKGKWDHERCEICNECICLIHGPDGYVNSKDHWVCPPCYEKYVQPMNFDFMLGE